MSFTKRRKGRRPFVSGYCSFVHGQHPCKGEFKNGSLARLKTVLCSCDCHGVYEDRLVAAGQRVEDLELPEDDEEDDDSE